MQRNHECLDCRNTWTAEVQFSEYSHNLSGEKTAFCPKCNGRNVSSSPAFDPEPIPQGTRTMTTTSLKQLASKVQIEGKYGARLAWDEQTEWQRLANGWTVTLKYQGRQYTVDFWQGTAIEDDPDAAGVLDCLMSDACSGDSSFEDFCDETGYDNDSRKAERTWRACVKVRKNLKRLLGDDFNAFMDADRD